MAYNKASIVLANNPISGSLNYGLFQNTLQLPVIPGLNLSAGDAAGKISVIAWQGSVPGNLGTPLAANTPLTVDLTAITDMTGAVVNMARVKAIMLLNWSATDGQVLTLDTSPTNGFTAITGGAAGKITVLPGYQANANVLIPGSVILGGGNVTGLPVTTSNKILSINPGANAINFSLIVLGNTV